MKKVVMLLLMLTALSATAVDVHIAVDGMHNSEGNIAVLLYHSSKREAFPDGATQASCFNTEKNNGKQVVVTCHGVEPGTYAIVAFHDKNSNRQLDHNWLGFPQEPFGFYRKFQVKFMPPSYDDVSFLLSESGGNYHITLQHMFGN